MIREIREKGLWWFFLGAAVGQGQSRRLVIGWLLV